MSQAISTETSLLGVYLRFREEKQVVDAAESLQTLAPRILGDALFLHSRRALLKEKNVIELTLEDVKDAFATTDRKELRRFGSFPLLEKIKGNTRSKEEVEELKTKVQTLRSLVSSGSNGVMRVLAGRTLNLAEESERLVTKLEQVTQVRRPKPLEEKEFLNFLDRVDAKLDVSLTLLDEELVALNIQAESAKNERFELPVVASEPLTAPIKRVTVECLIASQQEPQEAEPPPPAELAPETKPLVSYKAVLPLLAGLVALVALSGLTVLVAKRARVFR